MTDADLQHFRLSMDRDVAIVEIHTADIHGPHSAQELRSELAMVLAQDWARRVLLDFHRVTFLGSTGFAEIFRLVKAAREEGREVMLCGMDPGVRLGAEIIGLEQLVPIHLDQATALRAFARA